MHRFKKKPWLYVGSLAILSFTCSYVFRNGFPSLNKTEKSQRSAVMELLDDPLMRSNAESTYEGTIDGVPVGLLLHRERGKEKPTCWTGNYYAFNSDRDTCLEGTCDDMGKMLLSEINDQGQKVATLRLSFQPDFTDGEIHIHITGNRQAIAKKQNQKVDLHFTSISLDPWIPHLTEPSAKRFRDAIINGDKNTVATMIRYPTKVWVSDKQLVIANREELLKDYDIVFTKQLIKTINSFKLAPCRLFSSFRPANSGKIETE
jgi:hypothetical protein